ncbi:FimV family protein [Oceanicoccus sagamiensis]|uniref:FimV N-terminal domain-containing protein n=1 Tax=Oceanicoccus sagamiensis TaxID=716816 RepID=A0A1X9NMZ7_9GAMM|nr:hypothetical protein [Oceanicoccus sagamiensis]ARN76147.1 hypothetical protein BST96_19815 [Oceanicoccus sagamiensis]
MLLFLLNRIIARPTFTLILGLCFASSANSLEVGDLTVESSLGDPFAASFNIKHQQDLSEQELIIRQAPIEIYQQMGVDTAMLYQDLRFSLGEDGQVKITGKAPIKEPFLNFVVQVVWAEGEMVREFTVLLDPS